jgi:hypothetical protein
VQLLALSKLIVANLRASQTYFRNVPKLSKAGAMLMWLMICIIVGSANRRGLDAPRANQREGQDTAGAFGDDESQAFGNWLTTYHPLLARNGFST